MGVGSDWKQGQGENSQEEIEGAIFWKKPTFPHKKDSKNFSPPNLAKFFRFQIFRLT